MIVRLCVAMVLFGIIMFPGLSEAIPAFAKKYEIACSLCHDSWTRLKVEGIKFKLNGYQMPNSEDGGEVAKHASAKNLFLDVGTGNPPLSITVEGGIILSQPTQGPDDQQEDKFFCCVEGNAVTLSAGGTLAPNIGYWLSLPWGKENVQQAYLRFVNWFGPGYMSMDIGAIKVVDYDVVGAGREWFGTPLIAFHGSPYNNNSNEVGLTAPHNDTGVRFYGKPEFGPFTYEMGFYTGSQIVSAGDDDNSLAQTLMGRIDAGPLALSLRYWNNKTGALDQSAVTTSGDTITFVANSRDTDEETQQFILSVRYRHPNFALDATFDNTRFSLGDRATTILGTEHTFSQDTITRTGLSVGAIWYINSWFETGLAYGTSNHDDYIRVIDGVSQNVTGLSVGLIQLRINVRPTQNTVVALETQYDLSNSDARKRSDGEEFDAQNKMVLQWKFSF
jgi:hypothetical protein